MRRIIAGSCPRLGPIDRHFRGILFRLRLEMMNGGAKDRGDQLFNSSEKRLARIVLLSHFGKDGVPETVVPKISQETLAGIVGTIHSRVSFFMNRFRKLGFVHYNGGLQVHSSQVHVVLHD